MIIYHIVDPESWQEAKEVSIYTPPSLDLVGFIHASTKEQVISTANRRYIDKNQIKVISIETDKVDAEVKLESAKGGEKHPHVYGPIPPEAVIEEITLKKVNGEFRFLPTQE